jgi:VanZ family protein
MLPAAAWAALIFWLSSRADLPSVPFAFEGIDKLEHAGAYGIFGLLLLLALDWPRPRAAVLAVGLAALYGITDEWHQSFVPGRQCDPFDWLADAAGALLAVASWIALRRRRREQLRS